MGVTVWGGSGTQTTGAGVADGGSQTVNTAALAAGTNAQIDSYLFAYAGIPAGAAIGTANSHFTGNLQGSYNPLDAAAAAPLGAWSTALTGDVNVGVSTTTATGAGGVNAVAALGSRITKATLAGTGARTDDPIQGSSFIVSQISGARLGIGTGTAAPMALGAIPQLVVAGGLFEPVLAGSTSGEAYAKASGSTSYDGTGRGSSVGYTTETAKISGSARGATSIETSLDTAQIAAVSAIEADSLALPGPAPTVAGVNAQANAGSMTRVQLVDTGAVAVFFRTTATATANPTSGSTEPAAKSAAWDYTFTDPRVPTQNENAYAYSAASLQSSATLREGGDTANSGARINTRADHDIRAAPATGAKQYAATFIQTFGTGTRNPPGVTDTRVSSYGSVLSNAAFSSTARGGSAVATQAGTVGPIDGSLTQGFLSGGHMTATTVNVPLASAVYTQESLGAVASSDYVVVNRQPATIVGIPVVTANDPYGVGPAFWIPTVLNQGIYDNANVWSGSTVDDVGSIYGLSGVASVNSFGTNTKTTTSLSDINWIEGLGLNYGIQNLKKSFAYEPASGLHGDVTTTTLGNPITNTPYTSITVSSNQLL